MIHDVKEERFGAERFGDDLAAVAAHDLETLLEGEFTDCVDWLEAGSWEAVEAYFTAGGYHQSDMLESLNPRMRSLVLESLLGDMGLAA